MRLQHQFLALPTSLLLLISSSIPANAEDRDQFPAQWPYNSPPHTKNYPEDAHHRRHDLESIQEHILAGHAPVSVRKMSEDESEKFFPEYWGFRDQIDQIPMLGGGPGNIGTEASLRKEFEEEESWLMANASVQVSFRPAFPVHAKQGNSLTERDAKAIGAGLMKRGRSAAAALALLQKRDYVCPTGTSACSNAPNLCCATGEVCVTVTDTGLGSVGCCPIGATCAGAISCAAGNTACSSNMGGGCCISGYVCAGIGCVPSAVTVVTTLTQAFSSFSTLLVVTTIVSPTTSTAIITSITTSTEISTAISTTTSTSVSTTNTDTLTTTATASAPVRPTSASDSAQTTTTSTSITDTSCPTGYYACSAYYAGGCCRTGRDCATTNCPSTASTTLVSSGVTIVLPVTGAATTTASGTCATGWYSCAASVGGNCCPSGWSCGTESCTSAGATATATEAKEGVLVNKGVSLGMIPLQLIGVTCLMISVLLLA